MASKLLIGAILESANTVDILVYISEHPGCRKSEIYRNITRNAHTSEKLMALRDLGLLDIIYTGRSNVMCLALTPKGEEIIELLLKIEQLLEQDESHMLLLKSPKN